MTHCPRCRCSFRYDNVTCRLCGMTTVEGEPMGRDVMKLMYVRFDDNEVAILLGVREWFHVAKALPAKEGRYLVLTPTGDPACPLIEMAWWGSESERWVIIGDRWLTSVTHWMELPPPPE